MLGGRLGRVTALACFLFTETFVWFSRTDSSCSRPREHLSISLLTPYNLMSPLVCSSLRPPFLFAAVS